MDGNGRWAKARGLPRTQGHLEGVKRVEEIIGAALDLGIKVLTLYTFSLENWTRPETEVSMLMRTIVSVLMDKMDNLSRNGVAFRVSGSREGVPPSVLEALDRAVERTGKNSRLILNIAFNYGGRQEILSAVRRISEEVRQGQLDPQGITEDIFSAHLFTAGLPDPDLLIRTSGEIRLSNFLLWQLSYSEFCFVEKCWPDFTGEDLKEAIRTYQVRERRFGAVGARKESLS
ncbi:MAG: di-trans,poly-cis-decaprenylcistransferase [Elusimicrobia bacterium]|nr:di-trans,poly-cis-decaprenylcistransferase [Elusimicrobiota bacterium]